MFSPCYIEFIGLYVTISLVGHKYFLMQNLHFSVLHQLISSVADKSEGRDRCGFWLHPESKLISYC